jgi:flagellar FliL protein
MSSAAVADATPAAPRKGGGKKKLVVLLAIVLLVVLAGGGAMVMVLKKRAAAAEDGADGGDSASATAQADNGLPKRDLKKPPAFVPLDMFTVNLADAEAERYAQIGVTLEVSDDHAVDEIKAFMPAIRSNVLMVLARKTSKDLLAPEGKDKLAGEIRREALRALGIDMPQDGDTSAAAKKKRKRAEEDSPIRRVYFSNFIIQ